MGYLGDSWLKSAKGWGWYRAGLGLSLTLLATPAVAEWRIEAIIAGVADPNNAFIGDSFSGRCRVVDDTGTERAFEVLGGTLTGRTVNIKAYSDGDMVYESGQFDPRGETSDGATVSAYFIPRITGKKSVKVTATAYGSDRVCGWHVIHKG